MEIEKLTKKEAQELLGHIEAIIRAEEKEQRISYCESLDNRLRSVLRRYQDKAASSLAHAKSFRDDVLCFCRAMALVCDMAGNASTHAEKNARLRGMTELLESLVGKLRDIEFTVSFGWHWDDVFRSDYPTRHYLRRIHELEDEVERLSQPPQQAGGE